MAELVKTFEIIAEKRPCIAEGKKALFHGWGSRSRIVEPSPLLGGHNGGVVQWTAAIIEYEDGQVAEVLPSDIRFLDTARKKVHFEHPEGENGVPFCPVCGMPLKLQNYDGNYCKSCGAALDWDISAEEWERQIKEAREAEK